MSDIEKTQKTPENNALHLVELAEEAVKSNNLDSFAKAMLPIMTEITDSKSSILYVTDPRQLVPRLYQYQFQPPPGFSIEKIWAEQSEHIAGSSDTSPLLISISAGSENPAELRLYPLKCDGKCMGITGIVLNNVTGPSVPDLWDRALSLIAGTVNNLLEREKNEKQVTYLNTYLTVSSMLAQSIGLHELLEIALNCSMEIVSAEAASVLLLNDDKNSFGFYAVEGPAKPVLMTATLPADKGLASSVMQSNQAEVINDVQNDQRFYHDIDSGSGFITRNMIAIPLIAGEERIGVLEVLNKADGNLFTEDERLLLLSIAEEIAFAIRNAKTFEYVVDTYCKQRQGQGSCKGCKRPLGSWTPCAQQREAAI